MYLFYKAGMVLNYIETKEIHSPIDQVAVVAEIKPRSLLRFFTYETCN
jgi:hypothetical protein